MAFIMAPQRDNRSSTDNPRCQAPDRPGALAPLSGRAGIMTSTAVLVLAALVAGAAFFIRQVELPASAQSPAEAMRSRPTSSPADDFPSPEAALSVILRAHPELAPENGSPYHYEARTIIAVEDRVILIAAAEAGLALPSVTGSIGVFYLRATMTDPEGISIWPSLTIGAPMGRAPEFRVAEEFGRWPVLIVGTRNLRAGIACELTQLVELRPTGPVASAPFASAYDARGAQGPSGRYWVGRMRDVVPDGGFLLTTGVGDVRFVRADGRYGPAPGFAAPRC